MKYKELKSFFSEGTVKIKMIVGPINLVGVIRTVIKSNKQEFVIASEHIKNGIPVQATATILWPKVNQIQIDTKLNSLTFLNENREPLRIYIILNKSLKDGSELTYA